MAAFGSNQELVDLLWRTPFILNALTGELDDQRAHGRDPEGWSIVEIVGHLIDAERRAIERIAIIQREVDPVLAGYDQMAMVERQAYQQRSIGELLTEFEGVRSRRIAAQEALDDLLWTSGAFLESGEPTTLRDITIQMCAHDMDLLVQIAGIRKGE